MRKRKMYLSVEDIAELFGLSVSFAYRVVERMNADLASKNYDVCAILGVSKAYAYNLMREYNKELKAKGYIVVAGKISTKFLAEKIYGMKVED